MIQVIYLNGSYDFIKPERLDTLLVKKELFGFKRRNGWAVVGLDPIRTSVHKPFGAAERRKNGQA